jgi:hypothetical protein
MVEPSGSLTHRRSSHWRTSARRFKKLNLTAADRETSAALKADGDNTVEAHLKEAKALQLAH